MGNYEELKQAVSDVIKTNGNQEITGAILQNALLTIISTFGNNAAFAGIATPETNPGTPDKNVFYIASSDGIYSNFNGITLKGEVVILSNKNGNWDKYNSGIATMEKAINIEVRQIVKELYCDKTIPNITKVEYLRLFNGPQFKQIFLKNAEKKDIDAISLTLDGTIPRGLYKGSNSKIIYYIDNWDLLADGETLVKYNLGETNFDIEANPNIKNTLSKSNYATNNDIVNTIIPEIYLYEKKEVNKILLKVLDNKVTIQVFLYYNDDLIGSVGYYNSEIPPKVIKISDSSNNEVGKIALNYNGLKNYVDGTYTFNVVFDDDFASNILNFPIISSLYPSLNPEIKPLLIENPALYTEVSSDPIINAVISEMILSDNIDYNLVKRIRIVNGPQYKQIFLQNEDGSINFDAKSIVTDGSIPKGVYHGENLGVIYLINDWDKLPEDVSIYNVALSKKVTSINYNSNLKELLYYENVPSDSYIINSILKEIYLNNVCSYDDVEGIRLVRNDEKFWQIFFIKNIVNDDKYDIIAASSIYNGDKLSDGVYDVQGIKVYVDGNMFSNFFPQGKIAIIRCSLNEKTNNKYNWCKINNYEYGEKKEVLWLGTSIPAGSPWGNGYPKLISSSLNIKINNNAIGASFITYSAEKPSSSDESDVYKCFSLTQTKEEKEELFGDVIVNWSEDYKYQALNFGYDNLIIPYLNGTKGNCDIVIFDHGWNDINRSLRAMYEKINDGTINDEYMQSRDRNTFIGAFNFLYDKMLEANPKVRIIIAGYHENESNNYVGPENNKKTIGYYGKEVCAVQEYIANYYGLPLIRMWEKTNFTFKQIVPNTSNYLQDMGYTREAFVKDSNGNISLFDYYHPDGIHPYSSEKVRGAMGETYLTNIYIQELQGFFQPIIK